MPSLIPKLVTACALTFAPLVASAQTNTTPTTTGAAPPVSQTSDTSQTLKTGQLQQLVAPIALYPDPLLANLLMASTYPLEVVAADRFIKANKNLKGDRLKTAVEKKGWDKSVNELTATPNVLDMMSKQLDWTQKLGDAVLAQETEVMDSVQALRAKAQAENKLTTTKQQKVSTQRVDNRDIVRIEPAESYAMYVPYYDPGVVYGAWVYADYPPYYWPPPYGWGYYGGDLLAAGIFFTSAFALASWGNWWGGDCDWGHGHINVDGKNHHKWTHNAEHRKGVRYNNKDVANRFEKDRGKQNAGNRGGNKQTAADRKGQGSNKASNRGGNKQTAANRKGQGGNKAANRGGNKQTAANRKGQGGNKAANRGGNKQTAANRKGQGGSTVANRGGNKQLAQNRSRGGSSKNFAATGRHGGANFASGNRGRMSYAGGGGGFSGGRNFSGGNFSGGNFGGGRSFSSGGFGGGRSFGGGRGGGRGGRR